MKIKILILLLIFCSSIYAKKGKDKPKYLLGHGVFAEFNAFTRKTDLVFWGYTHTDSMGRRCASSIGLPANFRWYLNGEKVNFNSGIQLEYSFKPLKLTKRSTLGLSSKSVVTYKQIEQLSGHAIRDDSLINYVYAKISRLRFGFVPVIVLTKTMRNQFYLECSLGYQLSIEHINHKKISNEYYSNYWSNSAKNQYPVYKGWMSDNGLFFGLKLIYNIKPSDKLCL